MLNVAPMPMIARLWVFVSTPIVLAACTASDGGPAVADAGKEGDGAAGTVCATSSDCSSVAQASSSAFCCTAGACVRDTPESCTDANVQLIQATSYDRSCATDGDCMEIFQGNACHLPLGCADPAAINKHSYAQFLADLAKTRGASCVDPAGGDCQGAVPCCRSGSCQIGDRCNNGDASAE